MKENDLILASGSPRRRELLSLYTTDFTVCVSDFDESAVTAPTPAQLVEQLAIGKCLAVAKNNSDKNIYVQSARLNGKTLKNSYVDFNDIRHGGTLELVMGPKPSKWATTTACRP